MFQEINHWRNATFPYGINDPRLAYQSVRASQRMSQTITPRVRPKEVTDPWSEGVVDEHKIRDDRSILIDLTVLDYVDG